MSEKTNFKETIDMRKHITFLFSLLLMVAISTSACAQTATVAGELMKAGIRTTQVFGGLVGGHAERAVSKEQSTVEKVKNEVAGTALGVSGATMATVVGGSASTISAAMVGAPVIAGAGGFGAAKLLNKHVFNGDTQADEAGRVGTYVGATAGTAASVGTLAVVGAGPAGLATIGSAVGGGMAAGATVVLAGPIVAAAAVGAVACWLFGD